MPKTFTRNDIVQDVPDKPDQDGINVFFRGYGAWYGLFSDYSGERITSDQATGNSLTSGFFRLSEEDEIAYKYTNNYDDCEWLYPSTHPNDEFTKFMKKWGEIEREQWHREAYEANQESGHLGTYYHLEGFAFKIDTSRNRKFFEPDKPFQSEALANVGTSIQTTTEPKKRDLTKWMLEIWIKEGKPEGSDFFDSLKKYVGIDKSPIAEHFTASKKGAGIRWNTGNSTANMTKKTIQNKVGVFKKNEPQ